MFCEIQIRQPSSSAYAFDVAYRSRCDIAKAPHVMITSSGEQFGIWPVPVGARLVEGNVKSIESKETNSGLHRIGATRATRICMDDNRDERPEYQLRN